MLADFEVIKLTAKHMLVAETAWKKELEEQWRQSEGLRGGLGLFKISNTYDLHIKGTVYLTEQNTVKYHETDII